MTCSWQIPKRSLGRGSPAPAPRKRVLGRTAAGRPRRRGCRASTRRWVGSGWRRRKDAEAGGSIASTARTCSRRASSSATLTRSPSPRRRRGVVLVVMVVLVVGLWRRRLRWRPRQLRRSPPLPPPPTAPAARLMPTRAAAGGEGREASRVELTSRAAAGAARARESSRHLARVCSALRELSASCARGVSGVSFRTPEDSRGGLVG